MSHQAEYKRKLVSAEKAASVVKPGDNLRYGPINGRPLALDRALAARAAQLDEVTVLGCCTLPPAPAICDHPGAFAYNDMHFSKLTRQIKERNDNTHYVPMMYHYAPYVARNISGRRFDAAMLRVCPMDKHGWFNLGPSNTDIRARLGQTDLVIVEECEKLPVCLGGSEEAIHISEVDLIVHGPADDGPMIAPPAPLKREDEIIAELVLRHISDGSVIQLGIGAIPDAVGRFIAKSDLKDLGGHTEMFVPAFVDMIESGRMTGAKKAFDRFRVPFSFAIGDQRTYDFLDRNAAVASYPVDYTNDPRRLARIDKLVSICNVLEVDLLSQVSAESSGPRQISGNGGLWDFVTGALWSEGGQSFLCLHSTYQDKQGRRRSRIVPQFAPSTVTTIPRQMVDYIVTEYGAARMHGLSVWERAEAVIGLAHPEFRDELVKQAAHLGVWRQSNKRAA